LARENRVVSIIKSSEPFRMALPIKNAVSIFEITSGVVDTEIL
jgi:hypothetical protein